MNFARVGEQITTDTLVPDITARFAASSAIPWELTLACFAVMVRLSSPRHLACGMRRMGRMGRMMTRQLPARCYRDLASSVRGLPLHVSLKLLFDHYQGEEAPECLVPISKLLTTGSMFYEAMSEFPEIFPATVVSLVRISEDEGLLPETLELIADCYDDGVLPNTYEHPLTDLMFLLAVLSMLMQQHTSNVSLVQACRLCAYLYAGHNNQNWTEMLGHMGESSQEDRETLQAFSQHETCFPSVLLTIFQQAENTGHAKNSAAICTDLYRALRDRIIPDLEYAQTSEGRREPGKGKQFCACAALLLRNGFSLQETLNYLAHVYRNTYFADRAAHIAASVRSGETLTYAMEQHPRYFSDLVCQLVRAAEIHGDLAATMAGIVGFFDRESSHLLQNALQAKASETTFSFTIDGYLYTFNLDCSIEGRTSLSHTPSDPSHESLCIVVASAVLFRGLNDLVRSVTKREGMVFEAPAWFGYHHEEPEVLPHGVTVSYMDDEWLVVTEDFFTRFVVAFARACLAAMMDLERIDVQEVRKVRESLRALESR